MTEGDVPVVTTRPRRFARYIALSPAVVAEPGFSEDVAWRSVSEQQAGAIVSLSVGANEAELLAALPAEVAASFQSPESGLHGRRLDALLSDRIRVGRCTPDIHGARGQ